jgi:hypothetical protein
MKFSYEITYSLDAVNMCLKFVLFLDLPLPSLEHSPSSWSSLGYTQVP